MKDGSHEALKTKQMNSPEEVTRAEATVSSHIGNYDGTYDHKNRMVSGLSVASYVYLVIANVLLILVFSMELVVSSILQRALYMKENTSKTVAMVQI